MDNNLREFPKPQTPPKVVEQLEKTLELARHGCLYNIAIVADCNDGTSWVATGGTPNATLIGEMEVTQHWLANEILKGRGA